MSKLTNCNTCGAEIAKSAKSCPHCGATNKKPIYKRVWFWVLILLAVILFSPGGSDNTAGGSMIDNNDVTVAEAVLYDQEGVKITVTGMETSFNGVDINVLVENNTTKNLAVSCDDFVVNGITMYGYMYVDVAAGMKTNDAISFSNDRLAQAGIGKISTVESYRAALVDTDSFMSIKEIDFEITTSAFDYVQILDDSGDVLFDQKGFTVIAKTLAKEFYGGSAIVLIKNNTGKDIIVQDDNVSINGYTVSSLCSADIPNGSARFVELDVSESELEENGIEEIETITFTLNVINPTNFDNYFNTGVLKMTVAN